MFPRGCVHRDELVEISHGRSVHGRQRFRHDLVDCEERQPAGQEPRYRDLVGRVEGARRGAALLACAPRELEQWERVEIGRASCRERVYSNV